jgi:hypothetical protein
MAVAEIAQMQSTRIFEREFILISDVPVAG